MRPTLNCPSPQEIQLNKHKTDTTAGGAQEKRRRRTLLSSFSWGPFLTVKLPVYLFIFIL